MRVKTSITLSEEALEIVDRMAGRRSNRSRLVEQAVFEFWRQQKIARRNAGDLKILNSKSEHLNQEMEDILRYQAKV